MLGAKDVFAAGKYVLGARRSTGLVGDNIFLELEAKL